MGFEAGQGSCRIVRLSAAIATEPEGKKARGAVAPVHAVALLSRDGGRIFVGQARGIISVLDRHSLQFLDALKVATSALYPEKTGPHAPIFKLPQIAQNMPCRSMLWLRHSLLRRWPFLTSRQPPP